jgi:hypothetical protein
MINAMEPFDAYRYYQSIKLHFESKSYDAKRYNYKTSAKPQAFWKRRDKYFFAKLAKRFKEPIQLINYYVANFVYNDKTWIGNMLEDDDAYNSWTKKMQSLSYVFEQDLFSLNERYDTFDELFSFTDGAHPTIITEYLQGNINLETVVIINKLTGFMNRADKQITETILWPELSLKIRKYDSFLIVDLEKMKKSVLKVFTS